jgi:hypothetical protein
VKELLNMLFVTTQGASLRKDGENIAAEVAGAERARVRHHMLGSVMAFGAIFISPPLSQALAGGGITLVLLDAPAASRRLLRAKSAALCCCGGRDSCLRGARRDRA